MGEIILFDEQGVKITNAEFIVFGKSQDISEITSVKTQLNKASKFFPILLIIAGWATVAIAGAIAFVPIVLGIIWLILQKRKYYIEYKTRSGDTIKIENKNRDFIKSVSDALNNAMKG